MKKLPVPLVLIGTPIVVCIFAYLANLILSSLINPQVGTTVAGTILTTSTASIFKYLKDTEIKLGMKSNSGENSVSEKLVLRWPVMLVYGTLILFGVIQVFGGLEGLILAAFLGQAAVLPIVVLNNFLIWIVFAFFLGRWVGRKCNHYGAIILPIILILTYMANILSTFILPDSVLQAGTGQTREQLMAGLSTPEFWLMFALPSLILQMISCYIGFWRGYRTRATDRLVDLMGVLPDATKLTIVDLMYEEAQRVLAVPR